MQNAINRIGMQSKDVVGGITTADAGKEIGSLAIVNQAITRATSALCGSDDDGSSLTKPGQPGRQTGYFPPAGYVPLTRLKQPLSHPQR